jgi:hypothetical protein
MTYLTIIKQRSDDMKKLFFLCLIFSTLFSSSALSETDWIEAKESKNCSEVCSNNSATAVYGRGDRAVCASYVDNDPKMGIDRPAYKRDEKNWPFCKVAYGSSVRKLEVFACLCTLESNDKE